MSAGHRGRPSRRFFGWLVAIMAGVFSGVQATGQQAVKEDLMLDVQINYGYAYRADYWTPIDVIVNNNLKDISGSIEIQTFNNDDLQSPIYRFPAEIPQSSVKRFQILCYLENVTHIAARVLDERGREVGFPMRIPITSIDSRDMLGLLLDDEESGFGFMHTASAITLGDDRRFHRESLSTDELPRLCEYPQAYNAIDTIVIGKIDPSRLNARHQVAIENFVRKGGRLAVCLGEYSDFYRGTWIETLIGATIGSKESLNEKALAEQVFAGAEQAGAKDFRDCVFTELQPLGDTKRYGAQRTIATRRLLGKGYVYAIGVDADSHALQDCKGFLAIWSDILRPRVDREALNHNAVIRFARDTLPSVSGVTIHSKGAVMAYLGLYFGVAIVLNWLVFNWLKRRELAWVTLVIFSIGFTAYAMIFGTSGRARVSELDTISIAHVPPGGQGASVHAIAGVLTARSSRYGLQLLAPGALVRDAASSVFSQRNAGYDPSTIAARPFTFTQSDNASVDNLRVGASEMRVMDVEYPRDFSGGIDGAVTLPMEGGLTADLINNTGMTLERAFLFFNGQAYNLEQDGERLTCEVSATDFAQQVDPGTLLYRNRDALFPYGSRNEGSEDTEAQLRERLASFKGDVLRCIFSPRDSFLTDQLSSAYLYGGYYGSDETITWEQNQGPYVFGWVKEPEEPALKPDREMGSPIREMLIIADVGIAPGGRNPTRIQELPVAIDAETPGMNGAGAIQGQNVLIDTAPTDIAIALPVFAPGFEPVKLSLSIMYEYGEQLDFAADRTDSSWTLAPDPMPPPNRYRVTKTYVTSDYANAISPLTAADVKMEFEKRFRMTLETNDSVQQPRQFDPNMLYISELLGEQPGALILGKLQLPAGEQWDSGPTSLRIRASAEVPVPTTMNDEGMWK